MRAALHIACILAALLAEGNCLTCQECVSRSGPSCTGNLATCLSSYDVCISKYAKTAIAGQEVTVFVRSCGKSSECNKDSTLSGPSMNIKSQTTCCKVDDCTPETPVLPPSNSSPNGVTCRSCLTATSSSCYTAETMACTGLETKCIRYAVKTTAGSVTSNVAMRGCASPSLCATGSSSISSGGVTQTVDMACTNSGIHHKHSFFLLALTGLLLLQHLF